MPVAGPVGREERVSVAGVRLWTVTTGRGPAVVLAHGGPGMSDNLGPLAAMVDDRHTVHRYDQRACGRSGGVSPGQTVDGAVADLDALRAHWGHERWVVGGHSWGASVALLYALAHPHRTRAVLYVSGRGVVAPPLHPQARGRLDRLSPEEAASVPGLETAARAGDADAAVRLAHVTWRSDFSDPARAPDFATQPLFAFPRNPVVAEALRGSLQQRIDSGLAEQVRQLAAPVLVLHGEDDPLPVECAVDLADRLPRSRLAVLPGVGHDPWLEDPAAVRTAVRRFLSELPTRSSG